MDLELATLLLPDFKYILRRVFDGVDHFEYVLVGKMPGMDRVTVRLEPGLGMRLAYNWKQNEYGTFLGQHNMDWIIYTLTHGEEPHKSEENHDQQQEQT